MSGGSLDYAYQRLEMLADDLECKEVEFYDKELTPIQEKEVVNEINETVKQLRILAKKAHDLEWWFSGDYGDRTLYNKITDSRTYKE